MKVRARVRLYGARGAEADIAPRDAGSGTTAPADEAPLADALRREAFIGALAWLEDEGAEVYVGGAVNRVVRPASASTTPILT